MKGKKFIAIISIVCILAVILCIPAFATVTESDGDGFALYNGVRMPNIDSVWTNKEEYPYAFIVFDSTYQLYITGGANWGYGPSSGALASTGYNGGYLKYVYNKEVSSTLWRFEQSVSSDGNYTVSYLGENDYVVWSNFPFSNLSDNSIYLAASTPIPLDGYNLIEWDGDTTGLQKVSSDDAYYIATVDTLAVDAFTVMELSYSATPVVINGFHLVETLGWYVDPPASSYNFSAAAEINDNDIYDVAALKFDDVDDTGYTSLIAYRTVEDPPGEGGDTPDDPQPPFWAAEI